MNILRNPVAHIVLLLVVITCFFFGIRTSEIQTSVPAPSQPAATSTNATSTYATTTVVTAIASSTPAVSPASTSTATATKKSSPPKKASIQATKSTTPSSPNEILRIENPYTTTPLTFEAVNASARAALINVYCSSPSSSSLKPITASGIMVDPHGVVLTNAHVAQYVLIAQSGRTDLQCEIRTGGPAVRRWIPVVLYVPPVWIQEHAGDIVNTHALGTGEHDYALLYMASTTNGLPLPPSFAYVAPDVREAVGFIEDDVIVASYPVELLGGTVIQNNLYPVSSITTIKQLLTFSVGLADAMSLGGVIGAQSGSSGGAVVNQWNKLIGLITTTSEGATTGERDLHAITAAYIDRDLKKLTGKGFLETLSTDPKTAAEAFSPEAKTLANMLIKVVTGR